jgi:hypothetical protein
VQRHLGNTAGNRSHSPPKLSRREFVVKPFWSLCEAGLIRRAHGYRGFKSLPLRQLQNRTANAGRRFYAQQAITPQMVRRFARTTRERIRIDGGGYRRDHPRSLVQRVEVADREVRIIGSKSNLLQTLT